MSISQLRQANKVEIARWSDLGDRKPTYALLAGVDLVLLTPTNCPVGIATQRPHLRARLEVKKSAERLQRYFEATVELMKVLARACGHRSLSDFGINDLSSWKRDVAALTGVRYAGVTPA